MHRKALLPPPAAFLGGRKGRTLAQSQPTWGLLLTKKCLWPQDEDGSRGRQGPLLPRGSRWPEPPHPPHPHHPPHPPHPSPRERLGDLRECPQHRGQNTSMGSCPYSAGKKAHKPYLDLIWFDLFYFNFFVDLPLPLQSFQYSVINYQHLFNFISLFILQLFCGKQAHLGSRLSIFLFCMLSPLWSSIIVKHPLGLVFEICNLKLHLKPRFAITAPGDVFCSTPVVVSSPRCCVAGI